VSTCQGYLRVGARNSFGLSGVLSVALGTSNPGPQIDVILAAAWAHYKLRHDPPGLPSFSSARVVEWYGSSAEARAAAWSWYERRLALLARLEVAEAVMRTFIVDDLWPVILTWSDDQVAEVERWLVDPTAEMPEVLGG
jgi:hypothetical protein